MLKLDKDLEGIGLVSGKHLCQRHRAHTRPPRRSLTALTALVVLGLWSYISLTTSGWFGAGNLAPFYEIKAWMYRLSPPRALPRDTDVDWSSLPTGTLKEIQCWSDLPAPDPPHTQCYRLLLPLDYTNLSSPRRARLAVARYAAGGGATPRSRVLGTVFLNPGGPGGSGLALGRSMRGNRSGFMDFDEIFEGRYDIAAWDPRGVQRTWPSADCYPDAHYAKSWNEVMLAGADLHHASSGAVPHQLAAHQLLSKLCEARHGDALSFVTTASTARDLRALYRAFGDTKLNFAGFSYGTAIGAFFAAMFPQEVGRFWLDGVLDVPEYVHGKEEGMSEVDDVVKAIFTECARAGPGRCMLAKTLSDAERASPDQGGEALWAKILAKLAELRRKPHAEPRSEVPQLLTYGTLKTALYESVFSPAQQWPALTRALFAGLQHDDWSLFLDMHGPIKAYDDTPAPPDAQPDFQDDAGTAISYADFVAERGNESYWTVEHVRSEIERFERTAPFFGEIEGAGNGAWYTRGRDHWLGGFNATPATPILFASTELDPVTPLRGARTMARLMQGSHLVVVEGAIGHATPNVRSRCVVEHVRNWMVRGIMPAPSQPPKDDEALETVCQLDAGSYDPWPVPAQETVGEGGKGGGRSFRVHAAHASLGERLADVAGRAGVHRRGRLAGR